MTRYWVNTVSLDHVRIGEDGAFTQANHGRATNLRRLARGDWLIFYSPRITYPDGPPLRQFTAVGQVTDDEPYQVDMTPDFHPWRRRVDFHRTVPTPIEPMLGKLEFIPDKRRWGFVFRRGLFEIGNEDFRRIIGAMNADIGETQDK